MLLGAKVRRCDGKELPSVDRRQLNSIKGDHITYKSVYYFLNCLNQVKQSKKLACLICDLRQLSLPWELRLSPCILYNNDTINSQTIEETCVSYLRLEAA